MDWNVKLTATAEKQLRKLEHKWQSKILDYMEDEIAVLGNPRSQVKEEKHWQVTRKDSGATVLVITELFVKS